MTIVSVSDLDGQMGRHIDPNSIPRHDGADQGHMEAHIPRGPDNAVVERGEGRYGATIVDRESVGGGDRFYGSTTIISLKEQPPLMDKRDPDVVVVPPPFAPKPVVKAPAFVFPKAPPETAPAPVAAAPVAPKTVPMQTRTPDALLRQMGLKKRT
jgi:hypothetical protein